MAGQITGPTRGSPLAADTCNTASSTKAGDPAGCTGTETGSSPSTNTRSWVASSGGAANTAVTVIAAPGATFSPLLSLSRPDRPSAVSIS